MAVAEQPPIRLVVHDDDLTRNRLTVFFRLFLAIPHFIWLMLWGLAASVVAFVLWLAILISAEAPEILHDFVAGYVRYATHLSAYLFLAANPYPGFRGRPGYPVDVEIDPPVRQSRWTGFFRLLLATPAIMLAASLGAGFTWSASGGIYLIFVALATSSGVTGIAAILAWFSSLVLGREPRGLRDVTAYALGYGAQTGGYALLLTGRYPSSDPALASSFAELPEHPVQATVDDELVRSRLTVLFRLLLAVPHFVWLMLWSIARHAGGHRRLVRRARHRESALGAPPLPCGVRPLRDPRDRVRLRHRSQVPGLHRASRLLRHRHRDSGARSSEPLEDPLPILPRDPGAAARQAHSAVWRSSLRSSVGGTRW